MGVDSEITVPKEIVSAKEAKLRPWATVVYRALERAPERTLLWSEVYALVEGEVDVGAVITWLRQRGVDIAAAAGPVSAGTDTVETSFVLVSKSWTSVFDEAQKGSSAAGK